MALWFTADTHFGHKNIIDYCDRPFRTADGQIDLAAHDRVLAENWNNCVAENDTIVVLGDWTWRGPSWKPPPRLCGRIVLVKGNHDRFSHTQLKRFGVEVVVNRSITIPRTSEHIPVILRHRPFVPAQDNVWEAFHGDLPTDILCGHVHGHWKIKYSENRPNGILVNVGVDVRDYRPVSAKELEEEIGLQIHEEEVWSAL